MKNTNKIFQAVALKAPVVIPPPPGGGRWRWDGTQWESLNAVSTVTEELKSATEAPAAE